MGYGFCTQCNAEVSDIVKHLKKHQENLNGMDKIFRKSLGFKD